MTDVREPAASPRPRRAAGRGVRWCTGALVAGAALALGASPALAQGGDPSVDYPQDPVAVIAPGQTGEVKFGLKNPTTDFTGESTQDQLHMHLYAPAGTAFADDTVTPVGQAPGPWRCVRYSSTETHCDSEYNGVIASPGEVRQWKVNLTVAPDASYGTTLSQGGRVSFSYVDCNSFMYSPTMTLAVRTPPGL
ncbi:hypothetical protein [Streptomyces sp. BPTC-684]|uniref:hypothetical protein n=1 Tax=Streptomyces sp. BPTC-684 TaxID=3043734 RepID=UPI0024B10E79|nr:hypothetical protein [Streptomyces sp. BPTC-684]WHM40873.1 hypothetical protein QIY60_31005 [Streptomyces sp. BPTC-684]